MKGIILAELLEFSDSRFGPPVSTAIRQVRQLVVQKHGYTPWCTYEDEEIHRLISALSSATGVAEPALQQQFGTYLFHRFATLFPAFVEWAESLFAFLTGLDRVRSELAVLYPDAECPHLEATRRQAGRLDLRYRSRRMLPDLAAGLILGCAEHFACPIDLERRDAPGGDEQAVLFVVRRAPCDESTWLPEE